MNGYPYSNINTGYPPNIIQPRTAHINTNAIHPQQLMNAQTQMTYPTSNPSVLPYSIQQQQQQQQPYFVPQPVPQPIPQPVYTQPVAVPVYTQPQQTPSESKHDDKRLIKLENDLNEIKGLLINNSNNTNNTHNTNTNINLPHTNKTYQDRQQKSEEMSVFDGNYNGGGYNLRKKKSESKGSKVRIDITREKHEQILWNAISQQTGSIGKLALTTGIDEDTIRASLQYWRGRHMMAKHGSNGNKLIVDLKKQNICLDNKFVHRLRSKYGEFEWEQYMLNEQMDIDAQPELEFFDGDPPISTEKTTDDKKRGRDKEEADDDNEPPCRKVKVEDEKLPAEVVAYLKQNNLLFIKDLKSESGSKPISNEEHVEDNHNHNKLPPKLPSKPSQTPPPKSQSKAKYEYKISEHVNGQQSSESVNEIDGDDNDAKQSV